MPFILSGYDEFKYAQQAVRYGAQEFLLKPSRSSDIPSCLQKIAEDVGISHGYLSSLFNQNMGCSFTEYLNCVRVEHACAYLQQNYFKNYEIAFKLGFHDEKYFSKVFKKIKGISPAEYKKKLMTGELQS